MSNKDDDQKTRVQPKAVPGKAVAPKDDATVFAPKQRPPAPGRGAGSGPKPERPSKRSGNPSAPAQDHTRFAPPARPKGRSAGVDSSAQTRVNPRAGVSSGQARNSAPTAARPSAAEMRARAPYGLLKNRFILQEILGSGGMGVVYKAKDRLKVEAQDKDPYVAIKVLSDEFKSHPEAFVALQRESRKTQRIAHPNIVNVHDFDRDSKTVFMTMEFLDGKPLDKLLAQYRSIGLPREDCQTVLEGICSALTYAHAENIIHSDLKPGNIFVTNRGVPKVFDFGIARAVAKAERTDDNPEDKTVFDAGNLGALTPAYASLEMLEGAPPDARDDLYALGCIAYELFSGEHPFNRVHADEARAQKLKPKRISGLRKQQWRAIEACLAFERENRMISVEAFWDAFSDRRVAKLKYVIGAVVIMTSMAAAAYQYREEYWPQFSEQDVRSEIEQQLRLEMKRDNLVQLIQAASFTPNWEQTLWTDYQELRGLLEAGDIWLATQNSEIYQLYLDRLTERIGSGELDRAGDLLVNAYRYTDEHEDLDNLKQQLQLAMARQEKEAADQEEARRAAQALASQQTERREAQAAVNREFESALANVDEQLACRQQLNMEDLEIAVEKLRELDNQRYVKQEGRIVGELADCIEFVGETFAERAQVFKQQTMQIFPRSARVAGISIVPKDPCDSSLAGLGARGPRASCRDMVPGLGGGPNLVVVPATARREAFAIGKEEISVADYNRFCNANGCEPQSARREDLPVTGISISQAQSYMAWLSEKTGYQYRLPNVAEWRHAADAQGSPRDSNRNCLFESRGIQRGDNLARVGVGRQNRWGLLNHLGNAQEWVTGRSGDLVAAGGSYQTPMDQCTLDTRQPHTGNPDPVTGFRVLRELQSD